MSKDISYVAGLIDGEGCFNISKNTKNKINPCYYARFSIHMLDKQGIEFMSQITHLSIKRSKLNGKSYYSLYATTKKLESLIKLVYPYLKVKKEQSKFVLEFLNHCKKYKPTPIFKDGKFCGTRTVPVESMIYRKTIYEKIVSLKSIH